MPHRAGGEALLAAPPPPQPWACDSFLPVAPGDVPWEQQGFLEDALVEPSHQVGPKPVAATAPVASGRRSRRPHRERDRDRDRSEAKQLEEEHRREIARLLGRLNAMSYAADGPGPAVASRGRGTFEDQPAAPVLLGATHGPAGDMCDFDWPVKGSWRGEAFEAAQIGTLCGGHS